MKMKSVSVKKTFGVLGLLTTVILFQNCSKTAFQEAGGDLDLSPKYSAFTGNGDSLLGDGGIQGEVSVGTLTGSGLEIPVGYSCSTTSNMSLIRSDVDVATYFVLYEMVEGECMKRICTEEQRENILTKKKLVLSEQCVSKLKDGTEYRVYFLDSRRSSYFMQTIGVADSYRFDRNLKNFVSTDKRFKEKFPINVLVANDPRVGPSSLSENQCDHLY